MNEKELESEFETWWSMAKEFISDRPKEVIAWYAFKAGYQKASNVR